jgi:hypothetical protein
MLIVELKDRRIFDTIKSFVNVNTENCAVIEKEDKRLGFGDTVYVVRFSTVKCDDITIRFEEGLGKFGAIIIIDNVEILGFRYWPFYDVVGRITMDKEWKKAVTVTKDSFDNVYVAYDTIEALARKISLREIFNKIEEIERRYLEELCLGQKIVYTAWVAHAMEKLGMLEEKEQKTT